MINEKKLDKIIEGLLEEHNTASVQLAIIKDGEIITNKGYGYKDYENKIKTDEDTVYAIGSATKSFTAAAVAKLVEEGLLEWDKPVKSYIPEFEMYDEYVTEELTVRDILCHRCGLPRHDLVWFLSRHSSEELMSKLKYLKPSAPFRNTLQYQNLMFALAGYLIERVTNKRWHEFIDEVIIKPLGMENTAFYVEDAEKIENRAFPHGYFSGEIKQIPYYYFPRNSTIGAAGSILSNAKNLLKWVEFNLNKGDFEGRQIISEKEITECHTPQMINKTMFQNGLEEIDMQSYGLGWFIESFKGHKIVHHGGNINGFSAMIGFIPSQNAGYVFLTNTNVSKIQGALLYSLFDLLLGNDNFEVWNNKMAKNASDLEAKMKEAAEKFKSSCVKGSRQSFELEAYTGNYSNPAYGDAEIVKENSQLIFKSQMGPIPMKHLCVNTFVAETQLAGMDIFIPIEFKTDITGNITCTMIGLESELKEGIKFKKMEN